MVEEIPFWKTLSPPEAARAVSQLTEEERFRLLSLLNPEDAADNIEDIPEVQAAEMVEELSSDHLVDVLGRMDKDVSEAILVKMHQEDAEEARMFLAACFLLYLKGSIWILPLLQITINILKESRRSPLRIGLNIDTCVISCEKWRKIARLVSFPARRGTDSSSCPSIKGYFVQYNVK